MVLGLASKELDNCQHNVSHGAVLTHIHHSPNPPTPSCSFAVVLGLVSEEIKIQLKGVRSGNYPVQTGAWLDGGQDGVCVLGVCGGWGGGGGDGVTTEQSGCKPDLTPIAGSHLALLSATLL